MVVDLFNGGKDRCKKSKLWELWRDFWAPYDRIKQGLNKFEIHKVKSHSDHVAIVPREHKHWNDMVDKYAGEAVIEGTWGDNAKPRAVEGVGCGVKDPSRPWQLD